MTEKEFEELQEESKAYAYDDCYGTINARPINKHSKKIDNVIRLLEKLKYDDEESVKGTLLLFNEVRYNINRLEKAIIGEFDEKL